LAARRETLADDRPHRSTHEEEFERTGDDRNVDDLAAHGDQGILLASLLLCSGETVLVFLAIAELEAVDGLQVSGDLFAPFGVEEHVEPGAGVDTHVVLALRAYIEGLFQLGAIQHRLAGRALVPQTFRHRTLLRLRTHDRRDQFVYQPVAHALVLQSFQSRAQVRCRQIHRCDRRRSSPPSRVSDTPDGALAKFQPRRPAEIAKPGAGHASDSLLDGHGCPGVTWTSAHAG